MTVQLATTDRDGLHHYVGLSSDTKPTATTVPPKSSFWETDTDDIYWNSGTAWISRSVGAKLTERLPGANATLDVQEMLSTAQIAQITADTAIKTGSGYLLGFVVIASTSGSFIAYDNTSAAGTIIFPTKSIAVGDIIMLPAARPFSTGLFIDITNTLTLDVYYVAAP